MSIEIYYNNNTTKAQISTFLHHELIHAAQHCLAPKLGNLSLCDIEICRELMANKYSLDPKNRNYSNMILENTLTSCMNHASCGEIMSDPFEGGPQLRKRIHQLYYDKTKICEKKYPYPL